MLSLWEPISASLAPSTEVHNHAKMNIFGYKISSRTPTFRRGFSSQAIAGMSYCKDWKQDGVGKRRFLQSKYKMH